MQNTFTVELATTAHFDRLAALFEACSCGCHCRYWHFAGTKNDWLARLAMSPDENKNELARALDANDDTARGLVAIANALENKPIVGWMKLTPRTAVPKLRNLPTYRSLDLGDDVGAFSIGCFLVHPQHRKSGVARALVLAAPEAVRAWGGQSIDSYPHVVDRPMYDEEAWMGPASVFTNAGFEKVAGENPYPVLRRKVDTR